VENLLPISIGLLLCCTACWLVWRLFRRSLDRSDDPVKLMVKWAGTLAILLTWAFILKGLLKSGGYALGFLGPLMTAAFSIIIGIIWAPSWGAMLARPLSSLYDGGDEQIQPTPFYAIAMARRKRGLYDLAMMEVRKQLEAFPHDMKGHVMLAEILTEDLGNCEGGMTILEEFLQRENLEATQGAFIMNRLAEWELRYRKNPDQARWWISRIKESYPDTEQASHAIQRLAHMTDDAYLVHRRDPKQYLVHRPTPNLSAADQGNEGLNPQVRAELSCQELLQHLEMHPDDTSVREQLAWLYAEQFQRIDLALDQLIRCSQMAHQPAARLARWYHQMADLHCRFTGDEKAARQVLEDFLEDHPDSVHAETTKRRLKRLKLEIQVTRRKKEAEGNRPSA
jgi:tetratricopeptide (TPR) repeat protein